MQTSTVIVFCVILIGFIILIGRLLYINTVDRYEKNALAQQSYVSSVIPYKRGSITDRNGLVLANSDLVYHLILDPKVLLTKKANVEPTLDALVNVYRFEREYLEGILKDKSESSYVVLKKSLSYEEKDRFNAYVEKLGVDKKKIKGVWFEEEYKRIYPFSTAASHVIGFTLAGGEGTYGLEQYYNDTLSGINGRTYGYYDSELNIQRTTKDAQDGNSIMSTIDINVQRVVQKYVEQFLDEVGAENVGVVIMDANTAEILALQSNYSYDLNNPRNLMEAYTTEELEIMSKEDESNALYAMWRNFCVSDAYEPGSTFKPFTVAAALEEAIVSKDDEFYCDGGESFGETITIKCSNSHGHGKLKLVQTLMLSCNDGLMQIAAKEGKNLFSAYQNHFRFGMRTGLDIPGETLGELIPESRLNVTELATSSFGQSFTVSMVQMASAFSSLINGGNYYAPHLVKAIKNSDGATIETIEPMLIQKTVSADTSEFIKEAMILTVEGGTAKKAAVNGYVIGGKTGTAQKYPRDAKKNLVSFLGFAEADDTDIVIYVVVDEAHDPEKMKKSSTALEIAAKIMEEALPYLKVYPEGEINYHLQTIDEDDIITDILNNPNYSPENDEELTDVINNQ